MIETTNLPEILAEISDEMVRLEIPADDLLDTAGDPRFADLAESMAVTALVASVKEKLAFSHVVSLTFFQALAQEDSEDRREELVKLAALVVAWINKIDNSKS